ncbi:MAG: hypothetical protein JRE57_14905 [Deltaproteobacteria bacterium]|nr:hypothetical protein [Deltaproteobacteria bacterium]
MKNNIRIIGVGLALMAGILLVSGVAWAQATETPITIRVVSCEDLAEPEREWVDEDGVRHVRNELYRCWFRRDMVGKILAWASYDRDPVNGYYFEHGYSTFTGRIFGEETWAIERYTLEGTRIDGVWHYTSESRMHLENGGLIRLSGAWKAGERLIMSGTLLKTPGGAKRNGPRSK